MHSRGLFFASKNPTEPQRKDFAIHRLSFSKDVLLQLCQHGESSVIALSIYGISQFKTDGTLLKTISFNYSTGVLSLTDDLLAVSLYKDILIYNLKDEKRVNTFSSMMSVDAMTKYDAETLIFSHRGHITAWNYKTNTTDKLLSLPSNSRSLALISPNHLAVGLSGSRLHVYDISDFKNTKLVGKVYANGSKMDVTKIIPLKDNYFASTTNTISIWRVNTDSTIDLALELEAHEADITDVMMLDDNRLVSCCPSWWMAFWDISDLEDTNKNRRLYAMRHADCRKLLQLPDNRLMVGSSESELTTYDVAGEINKFVAEPVVMKREPK